MDKLSKEIDALYTKVVKLQSYNIENVAKSLNMPFDKAKNIISKVMRNDRARQQQLKDDDVIR
jgi:hypothetical protein